MKTKNKIKNMLLCATLITGVVATNASAKVNTVPNEIPQLSFSELGKPRALDLYWHRMAECETGSNWKDKGTWSGGLGIYKQTWSGYGGKEFASKPELATIDEQIMLQTESQLRDIKPKMSSEHLRTDKRIDHSLENQ